eukprot:2260375-Prymnesium_polylepis.2
MRSVLCPPVDAGGLRMRKSEPRRAGGRDRTPKRACQQGRCAAIVTRSHGRPSRLQFLIA